MLKIYYLPDQKLVEPGQEIMTLLDASLEADIPHTHICGGNARCSTCRVLITEGLEHCGSRTPAEQELADRLNFDPEVRLACQTELIGTGQITLRRLSLDTEDINLFFDQATGKISSRFVGSEKYVAILFADIRGFTSFSEAVLPYDVIYVLNRYFSRAEQVISRYGGVINTYMGDGFMALFGLNRVERPAERAVRAALDLLNEVEKLSPSLETLYNRRLRIGIGIHYGWTVIGNVGAPTKQTTTAIGDAVNFASRIEAANKQLGTNLLISEDTYHIIKDKVIAKIQPPVSIAGKTGEYTLYEVTAIDPAYSADLTVMKSSPTETFPRRNVLVRLRQALSRFWKKVYQRL